MQPQDFPDCLTLAYKHDTGDQPIHVDLPAIVYFHGGSLTVGNRRSWFPSWLHQRVTSSGMVFMSADYTLLAPATGHDILNDIKDLFRFLETEANRWIREACTEFEEPSRTKFAFEIDPQRLAVAGSSAGGLCVYLAGLYAIPKPKAALSLYGMGGDMLTWMYLAPKTSPFLRGREILDPKDYAEFLHPDCRNLPLVSDSPLAYHPPTHHIPNFPANPRMLVGRLYLQTGTFLDYLTGSHAPSLSASLRSQLSQAELLTQDPNANASSGKYRDAVPPEHLPLFPQLCDMSVFPPTLFLHGAADSAVWVRESENLHSLLQSAGVATKLKIVEDKEHSFDYEQSAEQEFGGPGGLFEEAVDFLRTHLST
ncbi:alpha/beta-hydrolase [Daedaleopsis nitida]|nr:alpha/beta-hydrolase [Daedaleopsis nitida]